MLKHKKIAALLLNWNCERFVLAHLKMITPYVDKILVVQATRPWRNYRDEHNISVIPDNSEQLIRQNFPEIQIEYYEPEDEDLTMFHSNSLNFGLSFLQDYDLVTKFDFDQYFTKEHLDKIFNYLHSTDFKCYALDWKYQAVGYYYDWNHGIKDQVEKDPLIVDPKYKFGPLLSYPFPTHIIEEKVTMHHFRNFKEWCTLDWVESKIPSPYGVYAQDLINTYNKGKWIEVPNEIKELFNES